MRQEQNQRRGGRIIPALVVGGGAYYAYDFAGPLFLGGQVNMLAAAAALVLAVAALSFLSSIFFLLGEAAHRWRALTPTGRKGTSGWVRSLREIKHELIAEGTGPYWGVLNGKPIFSDFSSSALILGPSGVGKGVKLVIMMILCIRESKVIIDFKSELIVMLRPILEARGEIVRCIDFGNLWPDLVGPTDSYNYLNILADDFNREGGLYDITDNADEMAQQLLPAAADDKRHQNSYFDIGSVDLLAWAFQYIVLVLGYTGTLGDVLDLLFSREKCLHAALWACGRLEIDDPGSGDAPAYADPMPIEESSWVHVHETDEVERYIQYFRGVSLSVAELIEATDSKSFDSFNSGARQVLKSFNTTTRVHQRTQTTTVRFSELKEGDTPVTVFILGAPNKLNAQRKPISLLQWCMFKEFKQHKSMNRRKVYMIADEATNFKILDIGTLVTWIRSTGLRLIIVIQALKAFTKTYSDEDLEILMSETEIKIFPPGQTELRTRELVEKLLGEQSIIARNNKGDREKSFSGLTGYDYQEEGRPLMNADEIRRTGKGILFLRKNKPIPVDLPKVSGIEPYRRILGINPYFGKPFLTKVVLRLRRKDVP